jgi:Methylamine utilisation protein MauE
MSVIVMGMEVLRSTALGIIFLASAVPKLHHPKGFVLAVLEYRILPLRLSWFYARLLPPLEFLLALLLLTGTACTATLLSRSTYGRGRYGSGVAGK